MVGLRVAIIAAPCMAAIVITSAEPAAALPHEAEISAVKPKDCDFWDYKCHYEKAFSGIAEHIATSINRWFRALARTAAKELYPYWGPALLTTAEVHEMARVKQIWGQSAWIANTIFVLFVIVGGIVVMGHETVQTSYAVKDIAPRLVVGIVAANLSLPLSGKAIELANGISQALAAGGSVKTAAKTMEERIDDNLASGLIFLVLLILFLLVLLLIVIVIYVIRVALLMILVAAAPLALVCHALPQTEGIARLWWRALVGLLAIQVAQSLVFLTAKKIFFSRDAAREVFSFTGNLIDILLIICLLYILIRIPAWISRHIWRDALGRSPITHVARYVVWHYTVSRAVRRGHRGPRGGRRGP